ncbi:hypothetical protein HO924_10975, partial [Streptococcus suis]|nr:hypothetical protein [Streptococcus suis]
MFKKSMETKGHGSIRKTKAYGAVAVLSLFGVMAAANGQTVSANEVPTEGESITSEASDTSLVAQAAAVEAPVAEVAADPVVTEPVVEAPVETVVAEPVVETVVEATPVAEAPVEEVATEAVVAETVAEGTEVVTNADTTVTVETSELSTAITEAQAAGVKVRQGETVNLGTATTEQEAAALQAEAETKQAQQAQDIQDKTAKYLDDVVAAQANTTTEGWLKEVVNQSLVYGSEPNATVVISNNVKFVNEAGVAELDKLLRPVTGRNFYAVEIGLVKGTESVLSNSSYLEAVSPQSPYYLNGGKNLQYLTTFDADEKITLTQTGLTNSTFQGKNISKVELDISIDKNSSVNLGSDVIYLSYSNDFAKGFEIGGYRTPNTDSYKFVVNVSPRFYDSEGNLIDHSIPGNEALLGFSSLNFSKIHTEGIIAVNDSKVVEINGSSITNHDGIYRANEPNARNVYGEDNIDNESSPNFWRLGAGAVLNGKNPTIGIVVATPNIYGAEQTGTYQNSIWFTLTSKLQAQGIITKPSTNYNLYSYDVAIPDPVGFVVVDYKDEDGNTIKERVTDTPESPVKTPYDTTDNKPKEIKTEDGSTIVEGTEITKYVNQVINYEDRTGRYSLDNDFLGAIALESPLQVAGYMQVTVEEHG